MNYSEINAAAKAANASNKIIHAEFLAEAREDGIGLVHVHNTRGGITVAFRPTTQYKNCVMVDVAVHTCSVNDNFNRKIGAVGALEKFYLGETIQLPLLHAFAREDLSFAVKLAFTAMYSSVS